MNKEHHSGSLFYLCHLLGAFIFICFCLDARAQSFYSRDNNTGMAIHQSSWDGNIFSVPANPTLGSGTVVIKGYLLHGISGMPDNATFTNTGTSLLVEDTLRIFGDLTMYNGASLQIKAGGVLIVHGNYLQDANVNFNNQGNAVFLGNWQSGINPTSTFNTGNLYVAGTFSASGSTITPKPYTQLQTDNSLLDAFTRNIPVAAECANANTGSVSFDGITNSIGHWESSTDFFKSQVTVINVTQASLSYTNLTNTISYRVYYKKNGSFLYSDAKTIVVRDMEAGSQPAAIKPEVAGIDLIASYSFDGNVLDGSGQGNNGTIVGGALPVTDRFNSAGNAFDFDGVDDYISTTTLYPAPGPNVFSLSIWFKTTTSTGGKLIGFGDKQTGESDKRDRHIYMNNSGQLYFGVFPDQSQVVINTTESYNDGQWHHVVATLSTSGMELYVDGVLKAGNAAITGGENFAGYWRIGYDALASWPSDPTSRRFNGILDDVYIFNKRISAGEVQKLYNAGTAPVCTGESVRLVAATVKGATYSWSGPDGFVSAEQNPLLTAVTAAKGGQYSVTISLDGCQSGGTTDLVITPDVMGGDIVTSQSSVCSGNNSFTLKLQNHVGSIIRWESSTDNFANGINPIAHLSAELSISDLSARTSFRALVRSGNCGEAISLPVTIEVDTPAIGGTVNGSEVVCSGENSGNLSLSGHTGNILNWEASEDDFITFEPIAATSPTISYSNLLKTTSYRAVIGNSGTCGSVYSSVAKITVKPLILEATDVAGVSGGGYHFYYPLDGNGLDFSGNNNHGIIIEAIPGTDRSGAEGSAYIFDGVDDVIHSTAQIPSPGPLLFSISIWFKTIETTGGRLIGYSNSQTGWSSSFDRHIYMSDQGDLYFGTYGDWTYKTVHAVGKYNDGEWHHAVATFSSSAMALYVDGVLQESISDALSAHEFTGFWRIGGDSMGGGWPGTPTHPFFEGSVDEVMVFDRELSAAEVKQLYTTAEENICAGENLSLTAPSVAGASYSWTGPDNFTSLLQNPVINNVSEINAGEYVVNISLDGCQQELQSIINIIPTAAGGTLTSGQTNVCVGSNSGTLNLDGNSGTIVRWESSTDGFVELITPITHTEAAYTFSDLTETTYFRVVVGSGNGCADQYSSEIMITVDPATKGGAAVASSNKVCAGINSGTISLSGQLGGVLRWESSTDNFSANIDTIASTTLSIPFLNLGLTTSFRAIVKSGACGEEPSTATTVVVDAPSVGGIIEGSSELCAGSNSGTLSLGGHTGNVVRWESSSDAAFTIVKNEGVNATTPNELAYLNLNSTTYYRAVVKNGVCGEVLSRVAELKVGSVSGGELSGGQRVCQGNNSGTIVLSAYSGSIVRWESSTDDFITEVIPVSHTGTELGFTNLSTSTSYRAIVGNGGICPEVASTVVKIVVEAAVSGGNLTSDQTHVCSGNNTGTINLTGHSGTILRWESSTDGFVNNINPIVFTGSIYTFTNLLQTTSFRALLGNGDICASEYSSEVSIIVDPVSIGGVATASVANVCESINSGAIDLSGHTGDILRWESSTDNFSSNIISIPSTAISIPFQNLGETSSFRAVIKNGICGEVVSAAATVVLETASIGGALSGGGEVCTGTNSGVLSLTGYSGAILRWESSTDGFMEDVTIIPHTNPEYNFSNLSVPTTYRVIVGGGSCGEAISSVAAVSFYQLPEGGILTTGSNLVCQGSNSGNLTLNTYQGNVLRWESSSNNFQTVSIINNTSTQHAFQNLAHPTSFRVVVGGNGGCGEEVYSSVVTINVESPAKGGELTGGGKIVCVGNNAGTLQLVNFQGNIIRWERSTDNFTSHVESVLATTNQLTYSGLMQNSSYRAVVANMSCGEVFSTVAIIEVGGSPVGGVLAGSKRIVSGTNAGMLILENFQGSILQWESSTDNFSDDIRILDHTQNQLSYQNLETNTWYRVKLGSADCAPVYSTSALLTINHEPEAAADEFKIPYGEVFTSQTSLLLNDSDPDGDVLRIEAVDGLLTEQGNFVSVDVSGYFIFEPKAGFSGADGFQYQLCDEVEGASICTEGEVRLEVAEAGELIIYQGISPGNDGKNDKWVIQNIQHYPDNLVQVYNRHGVLVFEMSGYNNVDKVFIGFSNRGKGLGGNELPKDTYYYQIRLSKNSPANTGFVILNK